MSQHAAGIGSMLNDIHEQHGVGTRRLIVSLKRPDKQRTAQTLADAPGEVRRWFDTRGGEPGCCCLLEEVTRARAHVQHVSTGRQVLLENAEYPAMNRQSVLVGGCLARLKVRMGGILGRQMPAHHLAVVRPGPEKDQSAATAAVQRVAEDLHKNLAGAGTVWTGGHDI